MRFRKPLILTACVLLTLLSGVISGYISQRWGPGPALEAAAERVVTMPSQLGTWHTEELSKLGPEAEKMLRCAGNVVGSYRQDGSGDQVSVVMMVGPAGPLANHTPDVCYRASNYSMEGRATPTTIVDNAGEVHNFLVANLRENSAASRLLRVYYAWNMDGQWTSPESPRTTFAGVPMLYRIQVASLVLDSQQTHDPGERFLKNALPLIEYMYNSQLNNLGEEETFVHEP